MSDAESAESDAGDDGPSQMSEKEIAFAKLLKDRHNLVSLCINVETTFESIIHNINHDVDFK